MRMQFKRPARHGFSLIEVIVVIATVLLVLMTFLEIWRRRRVARRLRAPGGG